MHTQILLKSKMNIRILCCAAMLLCAGCNKEVNDLENSSSNTSASQSSEYIEYKIPAGAHSSDKSIFKSIETSELKFVVKFDSSAIYQSKATENQYDINKLYGFSDNEAHHHQFSARFGWRWSDGALRLFAYVYNEGKLSSKELAAATIGSEIKCSIRTEAGSYVFSVNDTSVIMPRLSTTPKAKGYMLYPYFGGDETAPHEVRIWIKAQ